MQPLQILSKDKHIMTHKRNRSYFTPSQIKQMEDTFSNFPFPDRDQIRKMSKSLDISERSLQVWFQNRRARQRKTNNINKEISPKYKIPEPLKLSPESNESLTILSTKAMKTLKDKSDMKPLSLSPKKSKPENTSELVTPIRIENCHVSWAPTSPVKDSITSTKDNRKHITDDYYQMWKMYQRNTGADLDYKSLSKTAIPKFKAIEGDEASPLNLCIRDSSPDVAVKPKAVTSMSIFPNYSSIYGYPPPLPAYPPFGLSPFCPPYPYLPTVNGKLDGHMPLYTFPFTREMTTSDYLKSRDLDHL